MQSLIGRRRDVDNCRAPPPCGIIDLMRLSITTEDLVAALDRWSGAPIVVRVVRNDHHLLAVFRGRLATRWDTKHPSLFWALDDPLDAAGAEQSGVYLDPRSVEQAAIHPSDNVVEWRQGDVTLNIRRLPSPRSDDGPSARRAAR
jgi:hypothetical protein